MSLLKIILYLTFKQNKLSVLIIVIGTVLITNVNVCGVFVKRKPFCQTWWRPDMLVLVPNQIVAVKIESITTVQCTNQTAHTFFINVL